MGHGTVTTKSIKQKLNAKNSTETEVIGLSDILPYNIWFCNFMKHQGYIIKENILYQENQSAIRMKKNGRNSCNGRSRHISIRYFFVKDRVNKGEVSIKYCPSLYMIADYFTKALQGRLFHILRQVIMGHKPISWLLEAIPSIKERVRNRNKSEMIDEDLNKKIQTDVIKTDYKRNFKREDTKTFADGVMHKHTHEELR